MGENTQSKFDLELEKIGITLNERQKQQFDKYYEMLVEWNKVMNLTGITEYDEVNLKHFTDSLTIARTQEMQKVQSVIDIGTGAGFPGIPLKIAFPHLKVVLLDSLNKRIKFLDAVIEELGLENISTIHGRAEDFAKKKEYREQFDLCVSRAVANLSTLSEYCLPFVAVNGSFVSYKSGDIKTAQKYYQIGREQFPKMGYFIEYSQEVTSWEEFEIFTQKIFPHFSPVTTKQLLQSTISFLKKELLEAQQAFQK